MTDRKYEYRDNQMWHREGNYPVPSDEPQMTLRGKDPDTIAAINAYIQQCLSAYAVTGDEMALAHMRGAQETLYEFVKFQTDNPERVRRGCHLCDGEQDAQARSSAAQ